jgi:hypothetical protein
MLSQVIKTSAIPEHAIHLETTFFFVDLPVQRFFFSAEDLELRREALRS